MESGTKPKGQGDVQSQATKPSAEKEDTKISIADVSDLSYYGASSSVEEQVKAAVNANPLVVFAKSWCPFCLQVADFFKELHVQSVTFNLDKMANGADVQAAIKKLYQHKTVPCVLINGELVGGCDATMALHHRGELLPRLKARTGPSPGASVQLVSKSKSGADLAGKDVGGAGAAAYKPAAEVLGVPKPAAALDAPPAMPCLLWFPATVDSHVVRLTGAMICVTSILAVIFRNRRGMWWACLGLFIDFCLRVAAGAGVSPLGAIAKALCARTKPALTPGFPKQFAAIVGTCMSGLGTLFLFLSFDDKNGLGAALFAMLAFFSFLESVFDFCAGCLMFSWAVRFGLLPRQVYAIHIHTRAEVEAAWIYANAREELPETKRSAVPLQGAGPTRVDLSIKKPKWDEHTRQAFHPIKHVKAGHFNAALGLLGLAMLWKVAAAEGGGLNISPTVFKVLAIAGAVIFAILTVQYAAKVVLYPRKILKEWHCPVRGPGFAVPQLCLLITAFIIYGEFDRSEPFAKALAWIGAIAVLLLGFVRVSDTLCTRGDDEHINPGWMMPTVGCFIAAAVLPAMDSRYYEAAYLWFGFALIMWFTLFVMTFHKAIVSHNAGDRLRPLLWIWVAAPAVALVAYQALEGSDGPNGNLQFDFIAKMFYFFALSLAFVLGCGCRWRFWGGPGPFDAVSDWTYSFVADVLAIATVLYYYAVPGDFTRGMALMSLGVASWVAALCVLQTAGELARGGVFRADAKWGPMSLMKLTHEAMREWLPKLVKCADAMSPTAEGSATVADFLQMWRVWETVYDAHSHAEDDVAFRLAEEFCPAGFGAALEAEHRHHDAELARLRAAVARLGGEGDDSARAALISELQVGLAGHVAEVLEHLRTEEETIVPIVRKYVPLAMHKQVVRKIWENTPREQWAVALPWAVAGLPRLAQRVTYCRTFLWAMPERAPQIGIMLALALDPVQWTRLVEHVPELIPRGMPGWKRFY